MLGSFGMPELLIVMVIALLIFGPRQLPKMGRSIGEAIKEFRNIGREIEKGHDD